MSLDEALTVLLTGFLRGGTSFLKGTGEMIKGSSSVSREIRVGITQVCVWFVIQFWEKYKMLSCSPRQNTKCSQRFIPFTFVFPGLCGICARNGSTVVGTECVYSLGTFNGGCCQPQSHNFPRRCSVFPQVCQLHPEVYIGTDDWREGTGCCLQGDNPVDNKANEYCGYVLNALFIVPMIRMSLHVRHRTIPELIYLSCCMIVVTWLYIFFSDISGEGNKDGGEGGQHVLVCLLQELGCLIESLSTTSATIILDTHLSKLIILRSELPSRTWEVIQCDKVLSWFMNLLSSWTSNEMFMQYLQTWWMLW